MKVEGSVKTEHESNDSDGDRVRLALKHVRMKNVSSIPSLVRSKQLRPHGREGSVS